VMVMDETVHGQITAAKASQIIDEVRKQETANVH